MKRKLRQFLTVAAMAMSLVFISMDGRAQQNRNTAKGQMKDSGTEVGKAGRSMGRNIRHGRVVRGGKHFGRHMGRAGRHFGRGTRKAVKHVIS